MNEYYPRVLIVALGRINALDTDNNGLLLRNLFYSWPKDNLAQIYSSGDNGDEGFFGKYYKLGHEDRYFGNLFYKMKAKLQGTENAKCQSVHSATVIKSGKFVAFKSASKRYVVDTGLYEFIFYPRLSRKMLSWIREFQPTIILAQGYNLTFAWLPVMIKKEINARLAFLTTDDWPTYLYSGQLGEPRMFKWMVRPFVKKAMENILLNTDVPFAFGYPMAEEYTGKYKKKFITLSHGDNPQRFEMATIRRVHPSCVFTILATGNFNSFRWPLLLDANECCKILKIRGINARVVILSAGIDPIGEDELYKAQYIDILKDPGHDKLPSYLKGADLLLLAEGFDSGFVSAIKLSVSSKAHLFMFSQRPILVYGHRNAGIVRYADVCHWAYTVKERNVYKLCDIITMAWNNENRGIINNALRIAKTYHVDQSNQSKFLESLLL